MPNAEYEIHNTMLGSELVGLEYEPLFDVKELRVKQIIQNIPYPTFVSTSEGTGVVHTAVMYGEE